MARFPRQLAEVTMNPEPRASWPRLAFVDLETTGATASADRITEIGIVEVDEEGVREWSSLVNPDARISPFIERLTGISNEMVAGAPSFADLAGEVLARLEGRLFVAHNARFDYGFLKSEFQRAGRPFRAPVLCTVKLSRKLFPQYPKHNLDSLIERHGLVAQGRHRALADARLIHQFWQRLHAEFDAEALYRAVGELTARPSLPAQLDPALADELPEGHGVYLFYGEGDQPLFIGRSRELKNRVLAHFAAGARSARDQELARQLRRIDWVETAGEVGAQLLEAALIRRLGPVRAARPGTDAQVCAWRLRQSAPGLWQPELVSADAADPGRGEDLFGLFKDAREARKVLAAIAEDQGLCPALLGLEKHTPGRPCSAQPLRKCRGACVGREPASVHSGRLMAALARLRLAPWPYPGPAMIREGAAVHVVADWRYLGTATSDEELGELLAAAPPAFDADIYKILRKAAVRLTPLPPSATRPW